MKLARCSVLALALIAGVATAQETGATEEATSGGPICVGGTGWSPSLADTAQIESAPIPVSYSELFESTAPCERWALDEASLIDWHLRFGTEQSVTAALAYLERDFVADTPANRDWSVPERAQRSAVDVERDMVKVGRYVRDLRQAWQAALPDVTRAIEMSHPQHPNFSERQDFTRTSASFRRIGELLQVRENYRFLAEQYLRAGEEFASMDLLETAERYLRPVVEGGQFLGPLEEQWRAAGGHFNLHTFRDEGLSMRAPILRAQITGSGADIAHAQEIVTSMERPSYIRAAQTAFSGGNGFCDISPAWGDVQGLERACRSDDHLPQRVINYWAARAIFDLITGSTDELSGGLASRLLEKEQLSSSGRCCGRRAEDDARRLLLARADRQRQLLEEAVTRGEGDADEHWRQALDHLAEAERLTHITEASGRFRRIAEAWLDVWQRGGSLPLYPGEIRDNPMHWPEHRRYATYLTRLLANLDAIAAGAYAGE